MLSPAGRFWQWHVPHGGFLDGWHDLVYAYVRADCARQNTIMLRVVQNGAAIESPKESHQMDKDRH